MSPVELTAPPRTITYEEFLAGLDEDVRAEWVNGEVIEMSAVSTRHLRLAGFLYSVLSNFLQFRRIGELFFDGLQMKTGPNLPGRVPDLVFVANEHLDRLQDTYLDGPADLVVEIVSLDSRYRDRGEKFYEYEQGGVPEYWLIDPLSERAEFYRLDGRGKYFPVPLDVSGYYTSIALPDLKIKPDWLWQDPLPLFVDIFAEAGIPFLPRP